MILSMTGYGRGEAKAETVEASVEIRSLNNRFLDISVKLPKACSQQEQAVKDIAKKYVERGRLNISVMLKTTNDNQFQGLIFNIENAQNIWNRLTLLKKSLKFRQKLKLSDLLQFQSYFIEEEDNADETETWEHVKQALERALDDLVSMRKKEGEQLCKDLKTRIALMGEAIVKIEHLSKSRSQIEFDKLTERLAKLADVENLDAGRLEMEIAILADRVDVSEECTRFKSHNNLFLETISGPNSGGRRLNFLLQEMNREANTIGAKANDAEIAHLVVGLKEEIERIREQVQNIE